MTADLSIATVEAAMPGREIRVFPAMLSTESDAMAWARSGAPSGALVVADYQASARGRGGWPWTTEPGHGLGFSLVLRPDLPQAREGWGYVAASLGLAEIVADGDTALVWPDTVIDTETAARLAAIGVYALLGPETVEWIVVTVLITEVPAPRATFLARCVAAIEKRLDQPEQTVLDDYKARCRTLTTMVRARMIPLGPGGPEVSGEAVDVLSDGALVLLTARGNRVAVPPQNLGLLEDFDGVEWPQPPEKLIGQDR